MENFSDEQLMSEFGRGEYQAFTVLYDRHKASLYRYFTRQLQQGQTGRADELFQETWVRVVDRRESYIQSARFTTWLYQIARNLLIDEHRKRLTEQKYNATYGGDPDYQPADPEQRKKQAIGHCMSLLAPLQREAFLLRYESGFDPAQICNIVEVGAETVKTRLRYAMKQLRECLTRKLGERE